MAKGYRHVRVQVRVPGHGDLRRRGRHRANGARGSGANSPTDPKAIWEPRRLRPHASQTVRASATRSATRSSCCTTSTSGSRRARRFSLCKELEKYHLFFLEDPLRPEEKDHFRLIRQQSSTPLAMGELFNTQQEYAAA